MGENTQQRINVIDGILAGIEQSTFEPEEIEQAIEAVCEDADRWRWDDFMTGGAAVLAFKNSLRKELGLDE